MARRKAKKLRPTGAVVHWHGRLYLLPYGGSLRLETISGQPMPFAGEEIRSLRVVDSDTAAFFWRHRAELIQIRGGGERVFRILDIWATLLPTRIVTEDLGDYVEDIQNRIRGGQRWRVILRAAAAIFWTGLNAIGYAMKAVGKKSTG